MHIAASSPQWVARDDVPEESIATEREIFANTDEVQSKPEQAREKIVEGMLNKCFFGAKCSPIRPWIHDRLAAVGEVLQRQAPRCSSSSASHSLDDGPL